MRTYTGHYAIGVASVNLNRCCLCLHFCCIALGPQPVGVQCPITSSLGEFPGYGDWLRYPGLPPVLVSIAFSPSPSISRCFHIHSPPAIRFHQCFLFTTDVSAPIRSTLHLITF